MSTRWFWRVAAVSATAATVLAIVGIWTEDERWLNTGAVAAIVATIATVLGALVYMEHNWT